VSVTSSQGAAFGANFQPTPQAPPPTHLHPNNVQSPASFVAPQNTSSSFDSGCNELIIKLDDESRAFASNWNRDDVTVGDAAAGTFTTDGTATMYVRMDFKVTNVNWWHKRVSPYVLNSTGTYFQHAGFKMRDIRLYSKAKNVLKLGMIQGM
jgi:hypothetical protein